MIYLGADHGGYEVKEKLKLFLKKLGYTYIDLGDTRFDMNDDYPDYAIKVAEIVAKEEDLSKKWRNRAKGILLCRSSVGMVIAANKVKDIRAAAAFDVKSAKHSRENNDANILALSGDWTDEKTAEQIIKVWLVTEFSKEDKHIRRLNKIRDYENNRV